MTKYKQTQDSDLVVQTMCLGNNKYRSKTENSLIKILQKNTLKIKSG
jgi:hypothetical protein